MDLFALAIFCALMALGALLSFCIFRGLSKKLSLQLYSTPDNSRMLYTVEIMFYVFTWYGVSVGLTIFNKWFLSSWRGGFDFPLFTSVIHMALKVPLSRLAVKLMNHQVKPLEDRTYKCLAVPIGISTALDICLSNMAFIYVTVTFYTIVKAGLLVWILFFSVLFGIEIFKWRIGIVVMIIALGLSLASYGETNFSFKGLLLVLAASGFGGFRWTLTQLLLKVYSQRSVDIDVNNFNYHPAGETRVLAAGDDGGDGVLPGASAYLHALVTVYHISPASALTLVPAFLVLESHQLVQSEFFTSPGLLLQAFAIIAGGGLLAFALIGVEVVLVARTSGLTLGVLGHVKELLQIGVSVLVLSETLSWVNGLGLGLAVAGVFWYKAIKQRELNGGSTYLAVRGDGDDAAGSQGLEFELYDLMDSRSEAVAARDASRQATNSSAAARLGVAFNAVGSDKRIGLDSFFRGARGDSDTRVQASSQASGGRRLLAGPSHGGGHSGHDSAASVDGLPLAAAPGRGRALQVPAYRQLELYGL